MLDKTKRRIRIVVTDSGGSATSFNNLGGLGVGVANKDINTTTSDTKNTNLQQQQQQYGYNFNGGGDYNLNNGLQYNNGRSKNDKNWENWERIREQKLEKMKTICFESYRQSKRERMLQAKPKPKQLDSTWYTDNIYSNRSEDLEEDYVPDCIKYGTYRKLRNIREQDEFYDMNTIGDGGRVGFDHFDRARSGRADGAEASPGYSLHRSTSCKDFQYPKSQSCCFGDDATGSAYDTGHHVHTTSILKNRQHVPKSYSFSATSKTTPFDVMDFDLPPPTNSRREKKEAFRRSMSSGYYCGSGSLDDALSSHAAHAHTCCARERCTSSKCLLDEIYSYNQQRRSRRIAGGIGGIYGAGASSGSNRNLLAEWEDRGNRRAAAAAAVGYPLHHQRQQPLLPPPPPTMICCCTADDYCYHRQQQLHMATPPPPTRPSTRLRCPGHHPAAEEEEHFHCRAVDPYDIDLEHFIRDERERLLLQDKFLDEDESYLAAAPSVGPSEHFASSYRRPARSKSMLEVQPPARYDEDSCSDSTEMDLEDFNIDLEKYWEELEKPPSPIDLDMQRRNMHSNLKVKNVNVGCYNNGQPIALHDREQERMMIKKSLLEGMPSPPQMPQHSNASQFHFFEHAGSPLHRSSTAAAANAGVTTYHNYGHKVYPESLPSYKYNNFYPETHPVQTQQPTASVHHAAGAGNSALSLINNIFSIYKPNKYSPHNCQINAETKPEPCKKMNVPSTRRPLGAPHSEYMHSMKRPLIVSTEQPHFKIIPEKTGLKISPLYRFDDYGEKPQARHKLTSTARPLMLPH